MATDFDTKLDEFVAAVQKKIDDANLCCKDTRAVIRNRGSKWIAIDRLEYNEEGERGSGSVMCFVLSEATSDTRAIGPATQGDVMKPAGWKAPAKHPRGNIFNESGAACMSWTGAAYL